MKFSLDWYKRTNADVDWRNFKRLRNLCNNFLRKARGNYYKILLQENQNQPKKFWEIVKKGFPTKSKPTERIDKKGKVGEFSTYFSSIVNDLKRKSFKLIDFVWRPRKWQLPKTNSEFKFEYVSNAFIRKKLKKLNRKKATGLDEIPATVLKYCAECLPPIITYIVNLSITTSNFPESWKRARVTPIHKSGPMEKPENYRPISVLPIVSKICERAVHMQVVKYLEDHKLLSGSQYGYRRKRSTEQAATFLCDEICKNVNEGKLVGAVFIDLSRAFDTINHATLLEELTLYGIKSEWFISYVWPKTARGNWRGQI